MSIKLNQEVWVYIERLYIHCYDAEKFITLLAQFHIEYKNPLYDELNETKTSYNFMSEPNYDFANFMQTIPNYKYLAVLEKIIFDEKITSTRRDGWNYYGEHIKNWHPRVIELLRGGGLEINMKDKKLRHKEIDEDFESPDFLPYEFNDLFLDYIRKEINESYNNGQLLAVIILSRKLLEAITIRVMEVVFQKKEESQHKLWFDRKNKRYLFFSDLITNLSANSTKFDEDKKLIDEICKEMESVRKKANRYVHADYKIPNESILNNMSIEIAVSKVRKIYIKYCNP